MATAKGTTRKTSTTRAKASTSPAPRADEHGDEHREAPGPTEIRSQLVRTELLKAGVWLGLALAIGVCIVLIQPILLIFAAFVVAADGAARDATAIKEFAKEHLAAYKIPREVVFIDRLPRTPNGKVQRKALALPSGVDDTR